MDQLLLAIVALLILVALSGIKIVPQSQEYVVEQFGKYVKTLKAQGNRVKEKRDKGLEC